MADAKGSRGSRCPLCETVGQDGIGSDALGNSPTRRLGTIFYPKTALPIRRERARRIRLQNNSAGI